MDARVCVCILSLTQWESRWSKLRGAGTRSRRSRRMGMGRGGKGKGIEGAKGSSSGLGISRPQYTHTRSISHSLIHSHPPSSIIIFIHPLFLSLLSFLFFLTFSFHYIAHLAIYQAKPSNLLLLIYRGLCMHANAYIVRVLRVREADR